MRPGLFSFVLVHKALRSQWHSVARIRNLSWHVAEPATAPIYPLDRRTAVFFFSRGRGNHIVYVYRTA
jgi:hypothetical protein